MLKWVSYSLPERIAMQPANKIWYLMSRSLSGEASPEEEALLTEALQQSPALQQQYHVLKASWNALQKGEDLHDTDAESKRISRILQLAKVQELLPVTDAGHIHHRRKRRRRIVFKVIMYAGVTITAIVFTRGLWQRKNVEVKEKPMQLVATQNGSRTKTLLPDGTTVWLNAGSKIYFDNDFAGATREVKLEGEAYFDVTKNPSRPFIVHTGGINIRVLGTVFNVRSYPTDKTVETTLIHGLVQVTRNGYPKQQPVFIHPNEKLVIDKVIENDGDDSKNIAAQKSKLQPVIKLAQLDSTVKEADRVETAWVYNRLEFRGENFEELSGKMERWYNVSIVFEDEKVKQLTFNGSFERETVEQAFMALKAAVPFSFTIHGHEIKIRSLK